MSLIETSSEPIPAVVEQKSVKHRKPTKKIRTAIDLLLSGACRSQKAACERIKMDPSHLSRQMREPHVIAWIQRQTHASLAASQVPAASTLFKLLDAKSESVQKDVAIHLLGIAGHKPVNAPQVSVSIDIKAGYVIDLSDTPVRGSVMGSGPVIEGKVNDINEC